MTQETKTQRKTRLARERKQAQRQREKDKRIAMGARKLKLETYTGTRQALEQIRIAGEFDETEHAFTITIHAVAELSRRDPTAFRALMKQGAS